MTFLEKLLEQVNGGSGNGNGNGGNGNGAPTNGMNGEPMNGNGGMNGEPAPTPKKGFRARFFPGIQKFPFKKSGRTSKADNHSHKYTINKDGNGKTEESNGHSHTIKNWAIQPKKNHFHSLQIVDAK